MPYKNIFLSQIFIVERNVIIQLEVSENQICKYLFSVFKNPMLRTCKLKKNYFLQLLRINLWMPRELKTVVSETLM